MKVKCSRDGVADVNVILNRAGGACNGRKSGNTADLFAGVGSCFLVCRFTHVFDGTIGTSLFLELQAIKHHKCISKHFTYVTRGM